MIILNKNGLVTCACGTIHSLMKEIYDELAKWLQTQGFLPQDIFYTPPSEDENSCEPLIGTVTVKW